MPRSFALPPRAAALACAVVLAALAGVAPALADRVRNLDARHRDGQTFLTWTSPPGTGWTYRVYASRTPILGLADLVSADRLGAVGDSTWCDRRLSALRGETFAFRVDSAGAPLEPTEGLFVATAVASQARYFAVTAQARGGAEDWFVLAGVNATLLPIAERVTRPRPVFQRALPFDAVTVEIYTLWAATVSTPDFPAMASRPGLAFDCAIVRGNPGSALFVKPHFRGGNLLAVVAGGGVGHDWQLCPDDPLANGDRNTWWFGYHEGYDPQSSANLAPTQGRVVDYTLRRLVFTIEWARRNFEFDSQRIYLQGGSMGGAAALLLATERPELFAAVYATVPKLDMSEVGDPNPLNLWNPGGAERAVGDRLWGSTMLNLPCSDGLTVYSRLNAGVMAALLEAVSLPPILTFSGKTDFVVGWAEKIGFFRSMIEHRHGGTFFFDQRSHATSSFAAWQPMESISWVYRFRADRSYPALAHCSADSDPGDGDAASGDSIGTINGAVEWDTTLVDTPDRWEVTLRLRSLAWLGGEVPAPKLVTVDVTPRRLQSFRPEVDALYRWSVVRISDERELQRGTCRTDALGLLTATGVRVHRDGVILRFAPEPAPSVAGEAERSAQPGLSGDAGPVHGACAWNVTWRSNGPARIDLLDVSGRNVRSLYRGVVAAGVMPVRADVSGIAAGVYFVRASQGGPAALRRVILLR